MCIIHRQMTELRSFEVTVRNVMDGRTRVTYRWLKIRIYCDTSQFHPPLEDWISPSMIHFLLPWAALYLTIRVGCIVYSVKWKNDNFFRLCWYLPCHKVMALCSLCMYICGLGLLSLPELPSVSCGTNQVPWSCFMWNGMLEHPVKDFILILMNFSYEIVTLDDPCWLLILVDNFLHFFNNFFTMGDNFLALGWTLYFFHQNISTIWKFLLNSTFSFVIMSVIHSEGLKGTICGQRPQALRRS